MRARAGAAALLLLAATGCGGPGVYGRARLADLQDAVPVSLGWGTGASLSFRATPLFAVGLAAVPVASSRWGYDDRTFRGTWREYQSGVPHTFFLEGSGRLPPMAPGLSWWQTGAPLFYRWQSFRDAPNAEGMPSRSREPEHLSWGRHPPVTREVRGAAVLPGLLRSVEYRDLRRVEGSAESMDVLGSPDRATLWRAMRPGRPLPRAWDLFEADVMIGWVGARVGLRPVEFVDFLVGLSGLDLLGDDPPVPVRVDPAPFAAGKPADAPAGDGAAGD